MAFHALQIAFRTGFSNRLRLEVFQAGRRNVHGTAVTGNRKAASPAA
jgi:hypothetical protein